MKRLAGLTVVTFVVVCVLVAGCVVFAPAWLVRHDLGVGGASTLSTGDRLKAVNDVRATLLQVVAGVVALGGVGLGAVMTLRQIRVNRDGQYIDLFNKAVEQMASDQVGVRHGGVYAMERIADAVPDYRGHIAALLASFVRQQAPWPPTRPLKQVDAERQRHHGGLRDDVGGAMGALGRRSMIGPGDAIELEKVDLRGAQLGGMDLSDFCFAGANLDGADRRGCTGRLGRAACGAQRRHGSRPGAGTAATCLRWRVGAHVGTGGCAGGPARRAVPHAMLHDVPLHLVRGAHDGPPLGCTTGVSYASSMSLFARCAARNPARQNDPTTWPPPSPRPRTLAAGGVDQPTGREGMFRAVPLMLTDMFAGTDLIDRSWPGMTRRSVKDAVAAEPDVLMLVAHGIVDRNDLRMSGLLVHQQQDGGWWGIEPAPGQTAEFRDLPLVDAPGVATRGEPIELLTASELEINAQVRSELVVLLACSAGSGQVLEGDEPASLAETMLRLGAVSTIAALWDTDFMTTRDWVAAFFVASLNRGYPKALAARHAMRQLYARVGGERPDLCGALTVRGDWV